MASSMLCGAALQCSRLLRGWPHCHDYRRCCCTATNSRAQCHL